MPRLAVLVLAAVTTTCAANSPSVEFYAGDGHRFTPAERRDRKHRASDRRRGPARAPDGSRGDHASRQPSLCVIPETGETVSIVPPAPRRLAGRSEPARGRHGDRQTLDRPRRRRGARHRVRARLRRHASSWGAYPSDADVRVKELLSQPAGARWDRAMVMHPDGRRWIGYVGPDLPGRSRHARVRQVVGGARVDEPRAS